MLVRQSTARGLSLVELLVGIAIGLFILAGATLTVTGQLSNNRRLLADTQLQQDLRVAADIITHDVRRAGYTGAAYLSVWPTAAAPGLVNAYAAMTPESAVNAVHQVTYGVSKALNPGQENNVLNDDEVSGVRWNDTDKTLEIQLGLNNWQSLTDPNSMKVTRFEVAIDGRDQDVPCAQTCPAVGPGGCPLKVTTRDLDFVVVAQSAIDATVTRILRWSVRPRNDVVREVCP